MSEDKHPVWNHFGNKVVDLRQFDRFYITPLRCCDTDDEGEWYWRYCVDAHIRGGGCMTLQVYDDKAEARSTLDNIFERLYRADYE